MSRYISEESKFKQGRGLGTGADYIPWTKNRDFNSPAPASSYPDWKTGRMIECHSPGEKYYYIIFRWNDSVSDIREHYPLEPTIIAEVANRLGLKRNVSKTRIMETDFLITFKDESSLAVSIVPSREKLRNNPNRIKRLAIEREYWKEKGVKWILLYTEDLDITYARALEDVISYFNMAVLPDEIALAKYLIAHKKIIINLHEKINYKELLETLRKEDIWKIHLYMLD